MAQPTYLAVSSLSAVNSRQCLAAAEDGWSCTTYLYHVPVPARQMGRRHLTGDGSQKVFLPSAKIRRAWAPFPTPPPVGEESTNHPCLGLFDNCLHQGGSLSLGWVHVGGFVTSSAPPSSTTFPSNRRTRGSSKVTVGWAGGEFFTQGRRKGQWVPPPLPPSPTSPGGGELHG